jgi:hypothetical protein
MSRRHDQLDPSIAIHTKASSHMTDASNSAAHQTLITETQARRSVHVFSGIDMTCLHAHLQRKLWSHALKASPSYLLSSPPQSLKETDFPTKDTI